MISRPGLAALAACLVALGGCGGTGTGSSASTAARRRSSAAGPHRAHRPPAPPAPPRLLAAASASGPTGFVPAIRWRGRTAVWIARAATGVALLSFDQRLVRLVLHSGTVDAGSNGWRFGPTLGARERRSLLAAFNGGFKLNTGAGGFMSYGRVAVPLRANLGSIVTYADGTTDIGAWHVDVPAPGRTPVSVRQNLSLLVDHGVPAANTSCELCWGATLGGVIDPARSALGVTADRHLIWAGGEHLTPTALADALLGARVVRAVELDINPEWVAAYLYGHQRRSAPPSPVVPVVPGQPGVPGQFLTPYSRDFFTVLAR